MVYDDFSKEQLIEEIKKLKAHKTFGMVWEDKIEDVVEKCRNDLPVLVEDVKKAIVKDKTTPTNLIIEGDNFHALSVLNYTHQGKVDFIYIDPPYNTGARDWKYNNNYVDAYDSFRHSKWISFMHHRLILAKHLLKEDGVICVTIDDYEMPRLLMLLEQVFTEQNHLGTVVIRNNPKGRMTNRKVSQIHEYALFFGATNKAHIKKIPIKPEEKTHKYQIDQDGSWYLPINLRKQGVDSNAYNRKGKLSDRFYPIFYEPKTKEISVTKKLSVKILPIDGKGIKRIWRRGKDVIEGMAEKGDLWIKQIKKEHQVYFKFRGGLSGQTPKSIWYDAKYSASEYGTKILDEIMGEREKFQYPKSPFAVMQSILSGTNSKKAIILDFFAGSGTTGQAVMMLNHEDGGTRQYILCTNNENKIAQEVCYPRVKAIINGYLHVKGIKSNLRYFKTSFVPKTKVSDDTRRNIVKKSVEMICVRENSFDEITSNDAYVIYRGSSSVVGILFKLDAIERFKKTLSDLKGPIHIYVFSLTNDSYDSDFDDLEEEHTLCPIPESILEVYRKIFKEKP